MSFAEVALLIGRGLLGLCLVMCVITFFIPHHKARLQSKRGDASSQSHKTQPNTED